MILAVYPKVVSPSEHTPERPRLNVSLRLLFLGNIATEIRGRHKHGLASRAILLAKRDQRQQDLTTL
jgi:hypothetical protein